MLILSRKEDEVIHVTVGELDIEIRVCDIIVTSRGGRKVRLGITAPKHVPVHRGEVYEAIQQERETA